MGWPTNANEDAPNADADALKFTFATSLVPAARLVPIGSDRTTPNLPEPIWLVFKFITDPTATSLPKLALVKLKAAGSKLRVKLNPPSLPCAPKLTATMPIWPWVIVASAAVTSVLTERVFAEFLVTT